MIFSKEDTKVVKGMAIFLMLYHHLFRFPERIAEGISYIACFNIGSYTSAYWIGDFGKLCVAVFFFLSGYGIYFSSRNINDLTKMIWNKIVNLYFAYWKVFIIFIPICMLCRIPSVYPHLSEFIWNFTGLKTNYNGEWWFFTPYVLMLASYPVMHKMLKQETGVFADLLGVSLWNLVVTYILPNIYNYNWASGLQSSFFWQIFSNMLSYSPIFLMGCIFAKYDLLTKAKQRFAGRLSGVLLSGALMLLVFCMRRYTSYKYDLIYAPIFSATFIIFLSMKPCKFIYLLLEKVGMESTCIWLTHTFFCYHLCQRFIFLPRYTPLIFLLLLAVSYITSVLLRNFYSLLHRCCVSLRQR